MQREKIRALGRKAAAIGTGGLLLGSLTVGVSDLFDDDGATGPAADVQQADHVGSLSEDVITSAQVVAGDDGDFDIGDSLDRMSEDVDGEQLQHADLRGC